MGIEYRSTTALIVVDVQNDFADASGSLFVAGGDEIVEPINREIQAALEGGALVVYTQDWHPEETPHFADFGGLWPRHCLRDTWGAELHSDLALEGPVVRKGTNGEDGYSGFTMRDPVTGAQTATELDEILRTRGVSEVVVVGLALDVCVMATAVDADDNGYAVVVPPSLSAAADLAPGDGDRAIESMAARGISVTG